MDQSIDSHVDSQSRQKQLNYKLEHCLKFNENCTVELVDACRQLMFGWNCLGMTR